MSTAPSPLSTRCVIAGGGPAGMVLGLLLARGGIDVIVLEKHGDFLRDFRGDTIHPSTMTVLAELGLLERFLALPHQRIEGGGVRFGADEFRIADFTRLKTPCPFIALIPQWDFLDFLAREAARWPGFGLSMSTEATGLIEEAGEVRGVRASGPECPVEIRADLVVAADGRHSVLRAASGLPLRDLGAPIDVLWLRLPRDPTDPDGVLACAIPGRLVVMLCRGDYWQCAYVIAKDGAAEVRARGLEASHGDIAAAAPFLGARAAATRDWDEVKLLAVRVDRLERWHRPGLLVIGDAAHAMSPVGGVGINLAIHDAVAAANLLAGPLARGRPTDADLARVEARRRWPVALTQRLQVAAQNRVLAPVLAGRTLPRPPLALRLLDRFPALRRLPAYAIGIGPRPEHVRSPEVARRPDGH